jgi:hypothetical protein
LESGVRVVVGIPALNEERTIAEVVLRSKEHADIVLVVDDGSKDDTDTLQMTGADVVIEGRVAKPRDMPRYRWLGERALDLATQVKIGERIVDAQSGFRAYSRRAVENLVAAEYGMGVDSEVIMRAHRSGMRIVEVPEPQATLILTPHHITL